MLTSCAVTGFWLVLANSAMVLESCLRSTLHPTRTIGRPEQKWRTSEIHCASSEDEEGQRVEQTECRFDLAQAMATDLFLNVVQRIGRVDSVTDQDDVRVGVRQGTKTASGAYRAGGVRSESVIPVKRFTRCPDD